MILTGEPVLAKDIRQLGLVNHVVPEARLISETKEIARKIAEKGLIGVSSALKAITNEYAGSFDRGLELETSLFDKIFETEDWREGVSAFLEKRQPKFKDK